MYKFVHMSKENYASLVDFYCRCKDPLPAWDILRLGKVRGIVFDSHVYLAITAVLRALGMDAAAHACLEDMQRTGKLNRLNAALYAARWAPEPSVPASELISQLQLSMEEGVTPDETSLSLLVLSIRRANEVKALRPLLRFLSEHQLVLPSPLCDTLSLLILDHQAPELMLELWEYMSRARLEPPDQSFHHAQLCLSSPKSKDQVLVRSAAGLLADSLLRHSDPQRIESDSHVISEFLEFCKSQHLFTLALDIFQWAVHTRAPPLTLHIRGFHVVLGIFSRTQPMSSVLAFLQLMRQRGVTPTAHSYTIALFHCKDFPNDGGGGGGGGGAADVAWHLFHTAIRQPNFVGDSMFFNTLFSVLEACNDATRAHELLRYLRATNQPLTAGMFAVLIRLAALADNGHAVQEYITAMQETEVLADADVYAALLVVRRREANLPGALELFEHMQNADIAPNDAVFSEMIRVCVVSGLQWTQLEKTLRDMIEKYRVPIACKTFDAIREMVSQHDVPLPVVELIRRMLWDHADCTCLRFRVLSLLPLFSSHPTPPIFLRLNSWLYMCGVCAVCVCVCVCVYVACVSVFLSRCECVGLEITACSSRVQR